MFMEMDPRKHKVNTETKGLLDDLFSEVGFEDMYKKVIENEHKMSVKLEYVLNQRILNLSEPKIFLNLCFSVF